MSLEQTRTNDIAHRAFFPRVCVPSRNENKNQFDGANLKAERITMNDL